MKRRKSAVKRRKPAVKRRKASRQATGSRSAPRSDGSLPPSAEAGDQAVSRRPRPGPPVFRAPVSLSKSWRHVLAPAMKPPIEAYRGNKPYIFASYSHKNMKEVFSVIKKLADARFRVWYDEGIEPGNEWPEEVGKALTGCQLFLVFMSPAAMESRNVRNEINFASSENKGIMVVNLQPAELSEGHEAADRDGAVHQQARDDGRGLHGEDEAGPGPRPQAVGFSPGFSTSGCRTSCS